MLITKQKGSQKKTFGYQIIIEVQSKDDQNCLIATLDYLVSKKDKKAHEAKGKIIMLPKLLRQVID